MVNNIFNKNGFYFNYDVSNDNYECIKVFDSGNVKRINYSNKLEEIVDKIFYVENIPCDIGFINTDFMGHMFIKFNSSHGPVFYHFCSEDDNGLTFTINYPYGITKNITFMFYEIENKDHGFGKEIEIICKSCSNKIRLSPFDIFDVFICKQCRSIFTYEWIDNELEVVQIIKRHYIPPEIKNLLKFFDYYKDGIDKNITSYIKSKYRELSLKYHPDKVSSLGEELIELANKKTQEININYERLINWLDNNELKN
jgi:hypothetical protein